MKTEEEIETIANVAHEMNRRWCQLLDDDSQVPWDKAEEWQRESSLVGVRAALEGTSSPQATHEAWVAHKQAEGWIYGPIKDASKRTHPCIVSYSDLPPQQRAKDAIFLAVVEAFR